MKATAPLHGRDRSRHGRPVQQQEPRQARHLAQRPPSQGPRDREAAGRACPTSSRRASRRACSTAGGSATTTMREIKPDIIYVQQSGMGAQGTYGRFRTVGPIANSFAGLSEMSGLPEPAMPAGWGYSLPRLDGRLQLRARHARARCTIARAPARASGSMRRKPRSASSSAARRSSIGRPTAASGPAPATARRYKPAAPHGAYPCAGEDRWLAIACFTEDEWRALTTVAEQAGMGSRSALCDARRPSRQSGCARCAGRTWTRGSDAYAS